MPRDRSKARELQERGKTSGVDELQRRLQKESEELKKSRMETKNKIESIKARKKNERIANQIKEVPVLYMGAFMPCVFAVITICMNSVETGVRVPTKSQCLALWTYLFMSLILAYVFLFGLSMMFIGSQMELPTPCGRLDLPDCRCKEVKSVKKFYAFIFIAAIGVNIQGLYAYSQAVVCIDDTPSLYNISTVQLIFFYGSLFVLMVFGVNKLIKKAKNAKETREANKQASLERKIREEYESEPVEEEEYVYDSEGSEDQ